MRQAISRWAKRLVLAAASVAAILCIAVAFFMVADRHYIAQENRTHERQLLIDPNSQLLVDAHRLLDKLEPVSSRNSLRFVVMPSFGERWFAVSLRERNSIGVAEAIVMHPDGNPVSHRYFKIPLKELEHFFKLWGAVTDGYSGEGRAWTDGNPLAFELRRGQRITSGIGNSPCHYDVLGDLAAQSLGSYIPELADLQAPYLAQMLKSETCNSSHLGLR